MSYTKLLVAAAVSAVFMSGAAHASADATSDARKAIQAAYDARDRAMAHKDVSGTLACVAPDYIGTGPQEKPQTYAMRQQGLPVVFHIVRSMSVQTKIRLFKIKGTTAADLVETRNSMTILDPNTHMLRTAIYVNSIQDVWTWQGGKWLMRRSQQLSNKRIQ